MSQAMKKLNDSKIDICCPIGIGQSSDQQPIGRLDDLKLDKREANDRPFSVLI